MTILDLRNAAEMAIYTLPGESWSFKMGASQPVLIGATAEMTISLGGVLVKKLILGDGLTIMDASNIALTPPILTVGVYDYILEIVTVTGRVMRPYGQIYCR